MRKIIDNPALILLLRLIMAGVFLYAAYSKIIDPTAFAKSVNNYHILPSAAVNVFALILPMVEALAAVGLLFGLWRYGAALLINVMLVMFTVALVIAIAKGVNIDCGCFTQNPAVKGSLQLDVLRDLLFLLLALPLLFTRATGFGWK